MTTGYEDLIPNNQDTEIENVFEDLIPTKTKTEIPGIFSMDRFTDKKKFIGSSPYEEDYEDITDDLGGFDKFFFQTLGGNEKVFREKPSGFDFEALRNAVLSREASEIVGALGGFEGVRRFYQSTASKVFKKNPYIAVASVLGGALGATSMDQIYDRIKDVITGEEESLEEIYKKLPKDFTRNLSFELFGVGMASVPFYIKKGLMSGGRNIKQLFQSAKRFGGEDRIIEIEKLLKDGPKDFKTKEALKKELKLLKDKLVQVSPIDLAKPGGIAESFLRIGGIFPFIARPIKKFVEKRGERLQSIFDDVLFALGPQHQKISEVGETVTKLASEQYLKFRQIVGKEYKKFLDLASGKIGNKNINFNKNIVPLINRSNKPDKVPYLLDVAREIIRKSQGDGGPLPAGLQTEAYKLATLIVDRYGKKGFLDVDFLYNTIMQKNIKDGIKKSYATEKGASVADFVALRNAIKAGFENLDQTKIPEELATQINAQYNIANNMYKNGFENEGVFIQGIDLYNRAMGKSIEKIKTGIFSNKLTEQGKKYYADFVKDIIKFGDEGAADDLFNLIGRDTDAMGAVVRTYIDDAFKQATEAATRTVEGEAKRTFNFLNFDPNKLIKSLGYRDPISTSKGLTIGGKEEALTSILNTLNKETNGQIISGKDFRQFLNLLSKQGEIPLPDPNQFIKRAAVFGGLNSIIGLTIGGLTFGGGASLQQSAEAGAGGAGGISLPFTLSGYLFSNLLANPKNTKYLFESLDSRIPYFKRYSAGLRLLDIYKDGLFESSKEFVGRQKEDVDLIINNFMKLYNEAYDNKPEEGDKEPLKFQNFNETGLLENPAARGDTPDIVEEDLNIEDIEDIEINVPQPDTNFNMAAVIEPLPGPSSDRQPGLDPETISQLESVGLPFFANQGGIASLMGNKKPQQMVA